MGLIEKPSLGTSVMFGLGEGGIGAKLGTWAWTSRVEELENVPPTGVEIGLGSRMALFTPISDLK